MEIQAAQRESRSVYIGGFGDNADVDGFTTRYGEDRMTTLWEVSLNADPFMNELQAKLPSHLLPLFERRDGAAQLIFELPRGIRPQDVAVPSDLQRAWELCGLYFYNRQRWHEALPLFQALYEHMLKYQEEEEIPAHKGMPLVWMSDCFSNLGCPVLAKRYLMLTTCEDAIRDHGGIPAETTGLYFRMVWYHGLRHQEVTAYAKKIWDLFREHGDEAMFPEWIVQELDQDWMTEYPSQRESSRYIITRPYVGKLLKKLGAGDGVALERLAHYLLSAIPGCRAYMRRRSVSTDYDVTCGMEGVDLDFRSDLGRFFLCECKDWGRPVDFSAFAKFSRVLDSAKCKFGILFSREGVSGTARTTDAAREQLKLYQDRGMVVVVLDLKDLEQIAEGANLITMLRAKYEEVRLDLRA
jgi:hypothetical protein